LSGSLVLPIKRTVKLLLASLSTNGESMADFELTDRADFQKMVDTAVEETLTLEYKASLALTRNSKDVDELCKDVSAMANSAGGQIVYGIEEDKTTHKPSRVDGGVTDSKITREWIIQVLNSRIQPRIEAIRVRLVSLSAAGNGFIISVPATLRGPHQAPDKKYYKRFELHAVPMEDYEIRDVLGRSRHPDLSAMFHFDEMRFWHDPVFLANSELSVPIGMTTSVSNKSDEPAMFAVVNVFIDQRLQIHGLNGFEPGGRTKTSEGIEQYVVRHRMSGYTGFPVFKEQPIMLPAIGYTIPRSLIGQTTKLALGYEIRAPGCYKFDTGYIVFEKGRLTLRMPGTPLALE
jgi:hypothetical protein